jgi:hypothetical protein
VSGGDEPEMRAGAGIVGLGAAVCAACCAGPVVGFLAAAGLTALVGGGLFGLAGLAVVVIAAAAVWRRRRTRPVPPPSATGPGPVAVEAPRLRSRP